MTKTKLLLALLIAVPASILVAAPAPDLPLDGGWPPTVRVEGTASAAIDGTGSAARARAQDRARWMAHYNAQLRLAEMTGGLGMDSSTSVRDFEIVEQRLRAQWSGSIRAAPAELIEERVEEDVARARIVLRVPATRVLSPLEIAAVSLKALVSEVGAAEALPERPTAPAPAPETWSDRSDASSVSSGGANTGVNPAPSARPTSLPEPRSETPAARHREADSRPPKRFSRPATRSAPRPPSGVIVTIPRSGPMIGLFPEFFDASGASLGSARDLDPELQLAGLPLVSASSAEGTPHWSGKTPLRLRATVSEGDVYLHRSLEPDVAGHFGAALQEGRVVIAIDEEA